MQLICTLMLANLTCPSLVYLSAQYLFTSEGHWAITEIGSLPCHVVALFVDSSLFNFSFVFNLRLLARVQ